MTTDGDHADNDGIGTGPFRIGDRTVDPARRVVSSGADEIRIPPKSMAVLLALAAAGGRPVSRDELLEAIWDEEAYEHVLSRAVADLRRALDDDPGEPRYIETIPKTGYRLIPAVEPMDAPAPTPTAAPEMATETAPATSAAVASDPTTARRGRAGGITAIVIGVLVALGYLSTPSESGHGSAPSTYDLSSVRPLTARPGVEVGLDFAEDGRRAYAESMPDGRTQIVIEDEGGRRLQEISEPGALLLSPRFGPEGTLAMLKRDAESCTVLILRESEQIAAARCTNRFNTTIDWSDDGRWIVYTASEDSHPSGRRGLMLLDPATGAERALSEPPDGSYTDYLPSFSPASDRVAFIRGALSPRHHVDLFVATVAGGALERLTETAAMSGGAAWLDDSSLAFSSNHDGRWGLWRVGSDGQLTLIAPWAVRQLSVDRRDGSLGFTINDWDFGLLRLDLGIGGEPELLSPSTRSDKQPHAGARGVVFISDRSGHDEVWLHRDGELPRQLTQIDGPTLSWPRISPDGSTVAFVQDGHDTAIHLLDLARPGSVRTVTSTVASSTPAWMPDGALIGGCLVAGVWQLCRFDPNGETPLASRALFHPEVDQDGMIYATDGSGGIWRLAASGAPELVFSELPSQSTSTWTVAGGLLYFIALGDAELTGGLHRVDLATGEATLVRSLDSAAMVNGSLSVTPDGMVYYARLDAQNDDILILPPTTD